MIASTMFWFSQSPLDPAWDRRLMSIWQSDSTTIPLRFQAWAIAIATLIGPHTVLILFCVPDLSIKLIYRQAIFLIKELHHGSYFHNSKSCIYLRTLDCGQLCCVWVKNLWRERKMWNEKAEFSWLSNYFLFPIIILQQIPKGFYFLGKN